MLAADFLAFTVGDASGDDSPLTALESSAISVGYSLDPGGLGIAGIDIFARQGTRTLKLGEYQATSSADRLLSLDGFDDLTGSWEVFASARSSDGAVTESDPINLQVLPASTVSGDFRAETFSYTASPGSAAVYSGSGGTDTLNLGVLASGVASFNGAPLSSLAPNSLVTSQAIYAGSAFDYLRLTDGSEVYLQGIERLRFADGSVTELQTRPNDPRFNSQWNLAIADVPDAWRFTRGSEDVLVVSLDSGIPISNGTATFADLEGDRLIFRGNADGGNHGHQAVSIIGAEANNNEGIAGINWESPVLVLDIYGGDGGNIGINTAINTALAELNNLPASRIVFQGGIQGEFWLSNQGLQQGILPGIEDTTLFAIAAGNGGQDISITSHPDDLSGGVARLEAVYDNFIAVGALQGSGFNSVGGQSNASSVGLAGFSNFGENLTLVAPHFVPAQRSDGSNGFFTGTSAANPGVAGYSSLVWSINPELTGGEVRQILAETAVDVGAAGRDTTFGHGITNAGAAVRRAWALGANNELANLTVNPFSVGPELPGDFNLDGSVDAADYTVWRDAFGSNPVQYTGADASGDGLVDGVDHAIWFANFGATFVTTPLINATLGNGEFAVDDAGEVALTGGGGGDPVIALGRDRALRSSSGVGRGLSIDGWNFSRVSYSGGNDAFGTDGTYGFATDPGTGPGQTGQAFVNSGAIEIRSDTIDQSLLAGERIELSYLLGSDNPAGNPEATARLIFDEGLSTEFSHTFATNTASGSDTPAFEHAFDLPAGVSSVTLSITLDGRTVGHRALLDGVNLNAVRPSTLTASAAASLLALAPAGEPAVQALSTGLPADNFPAIGGVAVEATADEAEPLAAPLLLVTPGVDQTSAPVVVTPAPSIAAADEALLLLIAENGLGVEQENVIFDAGDEETADAETAIWEDALLAAI